MRPRQIDVERFRASKLCIRDLGDPSEDRTNNDEEGRKNRARHAHRANWPGEPASAKNRAAVRAATLDSCASGPEPGGIPLSFSKPPLPPPLPPLPPHTLCEMCPGRPSLPIPRRSRNAGFSDRPRCISDVCPFVVEPRYAIVPRKYARKVPSNVWRVLARNW